MENKPSDYESQPSSHKKTKSVFHTKTVFTETTIDLVFHSKLMFKRVFCVNRIGGYNDHYRYATSYSIKSIIGN